MIHDNVLWRSAVLGLAVTFANSVASAEPGATQCVPKCRSGFLCNDGSCVSACNPPCSGGMSCTSNGECVDPARQAYLASIHRHDGFYLRLALGIGYLRATRTSEEWIDPSLDTGTVQGSVAGVAQTGAFEIGGTPAPGLVIGGGGWGANAFAPTYDGEARTSSPEMRMNGRFTTELASTSVLGPFVSWYPDPARGLHVQIAAGLGVASSGGPADPDPHLIITRFTNAGWGAVLGAGYDFWVGEQWSLGLFARVSYVRTSGGDQHTFSGYVPALLATVTYH